VLEERFGIEHTTLQVDHDQVGRILSIRAAPGWMIRPPSLPAAPDPLAVAVGNFGSVATGPVLACCSRTSGGRRKMWRASLVRHGEGPRSNSRAAYGSKPRRVLAARPSVAELTFHCWRLGASLCAEPGLSLLYAQR
jgi:hypothetical protein